MAVSTRLVRCSWICHADSTKTHKLWTLRQSYPSFKMRAVTGPLKTGTYILEAATNDGEFVTISEDKSKFALTKCPESEATKVSLIIWKIKVINNLNYSPALVGDREPWKRRVSGHGDRFKVGTDAQYR